MPENAAAAPSRPTATTNPPAVPVSELWPWSLLALALALALYFVGVEQSAASVLGGDLVHEWVHDGRHLLGFPCH